MAREIISRRQYIQHWDYAVPVIEAVSRQNNIPLEQVTFQHIIRYFEQTYNLHFIFFEKDPFPMLPSAGLLGSEYIDIEGLSIIQMLPTWMISSVNTMTALPFIAKKKKSTLFISIKHISKDGLSLLFCMN